jgi:outer membrane protein OmpA-like peptidoglycan-associated protein
VILLGSASPEGGSTYNQKLSERRVNAVKDYLVTKEGISADRLNAQAEGAITATDTKSWPFARKVRFTPAE